MKVKGMRILTLLLAVVLMFGLFPGVAQASAYEDPDLPAPIEGYDPLDPDNPYPYGLPVTEYIPEEELAVLNGAYPPKLRAAAGQGSIPDEMWDNTILRALEYTGYDVQRQKDNGQLYVYEYIASRLKTNDPQVLSDISYWESGSCPNGDETVADSSTPTGRAPNISYFEKNGLVCASFATYYLCNYLPNVEGIDTSVVYNKAKEMGASGNYYYLTTVGLWKRTLDALAKESDSGVTKYTDEDTAYDNLVPGDVVIFGKSDGTLTHVAIYAGAYNLYSGGGYNNGVKHFMIHVGNSRGPEISVIEWMSTSTGSKASDPVGFYHLDFNDVQTEGFIEINKKDPSGNALAGATFKATHQGTNTSYVIGPTNASGYAISGPLPMGKYTVVESVFPTGYQASGTASWEVELTDSTPNMTLTINAENKLITGVARIVKETTNGGSKAGWHFTVKDSAGNLVGNYITDDSGVIALDLVPGTYSVTETDGAYKYWVNDPTPTKTVTVKANETATVTFTNQYRGQAQIVKTATNGGSVSGWHFTVKNSAGTVIGNYQTDSTGVITLDLEPGTYTVTETDGAYQYWANDPNPRKTVTVTAGQTAKVTFQNQYRGQAQIVKTATNGGSVEGWHFEVKDSNGNLVGNYQTDSTGIITLDLEPGTYTVTETDGESQYWLNDPNPTKTVTVTAGQTAKVTFQNQYRGQAQIVKTATNGGSVKDWHFSIFTADGTKVGDYVTDSTGIITVDLEPGVYTVKETDGEYPYWHNDPEPEKTVTVVAGQTSSVTFLNEWVGKAKIIKTLANPEAGTVEGWQFTISRIVGETDAVYLATVTTGADGTIEYDLEPGQYLITELIEENSLWECITDQSVVITVTAGQTTEVPFTNALRPGKISIHKVDTRGESLDSTEFTLEWSEDGVNWQPVSYTDSTVPQIGGCTSADLIEGGKLVTDETGLVSFEGLYPTLQYRLTETKAKNGYQLLQSSAYEGGLDVENELVVSLKVVNAEVFTMPETGGNTLIVQPWIVLALLCVSTLAVIQLMPQPKKKEK